MKEVKDVSYGRLLDLLRHQDLVPLGTRIRTRLTTEAATRDELLDLLKNALAKAGNATLMTEQLMEARAGAVPTRSHRMVCGPMQF